MLTKSLVQGQNTRQGGDWEESRSWSGIQHFEEKSGNVGWSIFQNSIQYFWGNSNGTPFSFQNRMSGNSIQFYSSFHSITRLPLLLVATSYLLASNVPLTFCHITDTTLIHKFAPPPTSSHSSCYPFSLVGGERGEVGFRGQLHICITPPPCYRYNLRRSSPPPHFTVLDPFSKFPMYLPFTPTLHQKALGRDPALPACLKKWVPHLLLFDRLNTRFTL